MYRPKYRITSYALNLIDEARKLCTWVEMAHVQVSWLPILQKEAQLRTAHSSTSIEGNPLSYHQVKAIDRGEKVGAMGSHEREITNYLNAMRWSEKNAGQKITERTVGQLHHILLRNLMADEKLGKYKGKQNYVLNEKNIRIYTPVSAEETPQAVKELINWLNSAETKRLHSILTCAIFHHRFVSIHPFSDGNGRLARTLGNLILYQREFDLHHIFSLDEFFAEDRKRYYLKLQQARELDDDLSLWIDYVAEGVVKTLQDVKQRIEGLQVSSTTRIEISPRQEEMLRILRDNHFVRAGQLVKDLKVSRARVNQLVTPLIAGGLVTREGRSRATKYKLSLTRD